MVNKNRKFWKPYGEYSAEEFKASYGRWFDHAGTYFPAQVQEYFRALRATDTVRYAAFREATREFLVDPGMSFERKAKVYLDIDFNEEEARKYFESCWNLITDGEPFPIE